MTNEELELILYQYFRTSTFNRKAYPMETYRLGLSQIIGEEISTDLFASAVRLEHKIKLRNGQHYMNLVPRPSYFRALRELG